jgi:hypothetical protein
MPFEEGDHPAAALQPWLVEVEIESVDAFDVQSNMLV